MSQRIFPGLKRAPVGAAGPGHWSLSWGGVAPKRCPVIEAYVHAKGEFLSILDSLAEIRPESPDSVAVDIGAIYAARISFVENVA